MRRIAMMEFRQKGKSIGYWLDQVHHTGEPIILTYRKQDHVAIVPLSMLPKSVLKPAVPQKQPGGKATAKARKVKNSRAGQ